MFKLELLLNVKKNLQLGFIRPPLKIFQFAQTRPTDLGMGRGKY
jgi:hypothetical protein